MLNVSRNLFIVSMIALVASTAQAANTRNAPGHSVAMPRESVSGFNGRLELEPTFGFAFLSPGDLNSAIRDTNDVVQKEVKSFSISEFGSTVAFGLATTYRVAPSFSLGLGFNRLSGSTDGSAKVEGTQNSITESNAMAANLITAEARVRFAQSNDGKLEGIFAPFVGVGFYSASTNRSGAWAAGSSELNSTASGPVFGATLGGRYWINSNFALGMNGGYRAASSGSLKVSSQKNSGNAVNSTVEVNGKKLSVDASSMMIGAQMIWAI